MTIKAWSMLSETEIPGGRFGKRLVSRTFQNPVKQTPDDFIMFRSKAIPTIVIPVSADRNVVAVRMFRPASNSIMIELPGGNAGPGETPVEVGARELREETGCEGRIIPLYKDDNTPFWFDPASFAVPFWPVLAKGATQVCEPKLDANEVLEKLVFSLENWVAMCLSGEVNDAKSVTTTFLALPYLGVRIQF